MNNFLYKFSLKSFLFLCQTIHYCKQVGNAIYNVNPVLKKIIDISFYFGKYSYCMMISQRIEPLDIYWVSKYWLKPSSSLTQSYDLCEKNKMVSEEYPELFTSEHQLYDTIHSSFCKFYEECEENKQPNEVIINPIYIMKTTNEDQQICYLVNLEDGTVHDKIELKPSNAKLLSIEYTHPEMDYKIDFTLRKEWLIAGNILFTPTFVLRMLEYQDKLFYFDSLYKISLVDGDINFHEFGVEGCIQLLEDGYTIKTIDNIDNQLFEQLENTESDNELSNDNGCKIEESYEGDIDTNSSDETEPEKTDDYYHIEGNLVE